MISHRPITPEDFPTIEREVREDACHKDWLKPSFFTQPNTVSRVYEDERGPILFLRMSNCLRLHIQFCDVDKERIRKCLITQFPEVVQNAKAAGYLQIMYDTASRTLAWFCRRYLGFVDSPEERVLWLSTPEDKP
jgi:hypothetical protein